MYPLVEDADENEKRNELYQYLLVDEKFNKYIIIIFPLRYMYMSLILRDGSFKWIRQS